jgi:hypothetical protein
MTYVEWNKLKTKYNDYNVYFQTEDWLQICFQAKERFSAIMPFVPLDNKFNRLVKPIIVTSHIRHSSL